MLAPFIAPILNAFRWLAITAAPVMTSTILVGLLIKIGVGITSWTVITWTAETLRDMALSQLANIGAGAIGGNVLGLLGMFGVFEGLSLIVSAMLAKAVWLSIKPTLSFLGTT